MNSRFQSPDDVHDYLDIIPKFSSQGASAAHFDLDQMVAFCEAMGHPQDHLNAIHVAGTNGKGTTCQMLASVYSEAGYKTGSYTSPHLVKFNERIRIDGKMINDDDLVEFFRDQEKLLDKLPLTYFELSTCLAFWFFEKSGVDLAVIETGLGGRLDATNIIRPVISVITSIGMDHSEILGDSIEKIAQEKAGIIKENTPVVTGKLPGAAEKVIEGESKRRSVRLIKSEKIDFKLKDSFFIFEDDDRVLEISSRNRKTVDARNIAICLCVVNELKDSYPVTDGSFVRGIENLETYFPEHGHFQKLHPDYSWFFDGAHNVEAIDSLLEHVDLIKGGEDPVLIFSMMSDKASTEVLLKFRRFSSVYFVESTTERSATCSQIRSVLPNATCFKQNDNGILGLLMRLKTELVIFTGSFYFYSQVKKWMASQPPSEEFIDSALRR